MRLSTANPRLSTLPSLQTVNCPDCHDRGTVSLFRSWVPRVSREVAQVLRGVPDPIGVECRRSLELLLEKNGKHAGQFLHAANADPARIAAARFLRVQETSYLALLVDSPTVLSMPGIAAAGVLLLRPEGQALDSVLLTCNTRSALLHADILEPTPSDGAHFAIFATSGLFLKDLHDVSYRVHQWQRSSREGQARGDETHQCLDVCRLKISDGRLEVLPTPGK